jgi:hypothetical protein
MTTGHRWVSLTDDDLTDAEASALDALLLMSSSMNAGKASTCGYDENGYPLGGVTVAHIDEVVIGIAVRNAHDKHEVIVAVMEPVVSGSDQSSDTEPAESIGIGPDCPDRPGQ